MADHANVRLRSPECTRCFRRGSIVVEAHHDNGTFSLSEGLNASSQLTVVEFGRRKWRGREITAICRQQFFLALRGAPQVEHGHPACAQHEMNELVRVSQASASERFENLQQYVLHEIVCRRRRPQVAKTIQPNAWPHPAAHFGFRLAIAIGNARRQVGVAQLDVHRALLYGGSLRGIIRACR